MIDQADDDTGAQDAGEDTGTGGTDTATAGTGGDAAGAAGTEGHGDETAVPDADDATAPDGDDATTPQTDGDAVVGGDESEAQPS